MKLSKTAKRRQRIVSLITLVTMLFSMIPNLIPGVSIPAVSAHNLDASAVYIFFDPATQAMLDARIASGTWTPGTPLIQSTDELGLIIKAVPDNGTTTGVGGYTTFYIPNGVQVVDAAFVMPNGSGGYDPVPTHGQAAMPAVGAGGDSTVSLVGYSRGPNILGTTSDMVANGTTSYGGTVFGANTNLGTTAGVYGDTGIFFSTDPATALGTYTGGTIKNNSGDTVGLRTYLGTPLNKWDAWQMAAFGIAGTTNPAYPSSPIIDSNGRGYAPWGLANAVAGPQSGYAWEFDLEAYKSCNGGSVAPNAACINTATSTMGPWQRIQYPGSQISDDPPGARPLVQPYTRGADGSTVGYALSPSTPLSATTGQANGTPNAIRWAFGQLTFNQPEFAWVKIKVTDPTAVTNATGCPEFFLDTFGGDAGGDSGGKDHIWRYYDPNSILGNACLTVGKPATRDIVKVGDTFQYNVKVYNLSNFDMHDVLVTDLLPSGVSFVSAVPAQNSGPNPLVWNVGTIPVGGAFIATLTVKATGSGVLENRITVTAKDPTNIPITTTGIEKIVSGSVPLLAPKKSASPTAIAPGGTVQYTIEINNVGSGPSGSPTLITEYLPTGFTYQSLNSVTVNGASFTGSTSAGGTATVPTFSVPTGINAGNKLLLTFTAKSASTVSPGPYCNSFAYTQSGVRQTTGSLACVSVGGNGVSDTIWRDWNGDGVQNAGEEGISGIQVCATPTGGGAAVCSTTDANGNYLINGLTDGSYNVTVTNPPAGYTPTYDLNGTGTPNTTVVALSGDVVRKDVDFGYQPAGTGSIGDLLFEDKGNDGLFNGTDTFINKVVTVWLYEDTNGDGLIDPIADTKIMTTTTSAANGLYSFTGLAQGLNYIVDVDESDPDLAAYFTPNSFAVSTGATKSVTNLTGAYTAADFGYFALVPSSIGDEVCIDSNNDGLCAGEILLPGVTVQLYKDGSPFKTTTTNITGTYSFAGLGPGNYTVIVDTTDTDIPGGYFPSANNIPVTLGVGENRTNVDFPFVPLISKQVSKTKANPGETLAYTITASYPGSQLLTNVIVTDAIPAGTKYVADSDTPEATVTPADNNTATLINWNLGSNVAGVPGITPGTALCPVPDLVLQGVAQVDDTFIDEGNPGNNNGAVNRIRIDSDARRHGLLSFNLSSIPANAVIQSAKLEVMLQGGNNADRTLSIRSLTRSWTEGTGSNATCTTGATWNAPNCSDSWNGSGGNFSTAPYGAEIAAISPALKDVYYAVDVKNTVATWAGVTASATNYGFAVLGTGTDTGEVTLFASEEGNTAREPKLTVIYLVPTANGCSGTKTLLSTADTYLDENAPTNNQDGNRMRIRPDAGNRNESLVKFDVSGIPPGAVINSATFTVTTQRNIADVSGTVYGMKTPWTETGATWNTRDGSTPWASGGAFSLTAGQDYDATSYGTKAIPVKDTGYSFNVTGLVDRWVNNTLTNNGLVILASGTATDRQELYTRSDAGLEPTLVVSWTLAAGVGTTTTVSAGPTLVSHGGQISVKLSITSSQAITNVTASTPLTVTGTNGAAATCGSPTPATQNVISNTITTFTYTCTANTSGVTALPARLIFTATATSALGTQFALGTSNSVLLAPPLRFQATVDTPATVDPVINTAFIKSASVIPATPSDPVQTAIQPSIGDRVWADLDGDGVQDPGEPGLSGVQVCATPVGGGAAKCATTDASGIYRIFSLAPATDFVVTMTPATLPVNYQPTTATSLAVTQGQLGAVNQYYSNADFGLRPPGGATIGDTVWLDADEDGVVDGGETRLPGITVKLYDSAGTNLLATTTTGASGLYTFTGLYAGNYVVRVDETSVVTTSYGVTGTLAGVMDLVSGMNGNIATPTNPVTVNVPTDSSTVDTVDFGYNWSGQVGDLTYYDNNGNGVYEPGSGETPAHLVTQVLYYDADGNGKVSSGDPIVAVVETNGSGAYLVDNLPPGNYVMDPDEQTVESPTTPGKYSVMITSSPETIAFTLGMGSGQSMTNLDVDSGFIEAAIVEGYVFHDVNFNGLKDGETGLPAVSVTITGTDIGGNPVNITMDTDSSGEYKFIVPPGTYTIAYNTTDPQIPGDLGTKTTPISTTFTALAGSEYKGSSFNFGLDNTGKVGDLVWNDANGDGVKQTGESGLKEVTVQLYDSAGTTLLATTVTTNTGGYLFSGLADGTYVVKVVTSTIPLATPPGFLQTGDPDAVMNSQGTATVAGGGTDLSMDFGYQLQTILRTISGRVYDDLNNNNNDDTEPAMAGVDITVQCDTGTYSTITTGTGAWSISGIPNGSVCTVIDADEADLSSAAYVGTEAPTTPLTVNADVTGLDFGYNLRLGRISGAVCATSTGNLGSGPCDDATETPLQGVTVTLTYFGPDGILGTADDTITVTNTSAGGTYQFPDLEPGQYQIVETDPTGYSSLGDTDGGNPNVISPATLTVGQNLTGRNFEDKLDFVPATISGTVFNDPAGNGSGTTGISGVLITLSNGMTTTTDVNGVYTFTVNAAGSYTITETNPVNYISTSDVQGSPTDDQIAVTVSSGQTITGRNFWDQLPATARLGDLVWNDLDKDGIKDANEPGIPGAKVMVTGYGGDGILGTTDDTVITATTDINGIYTATNLLPDTYHVLVDVLTLPEGFESVAGPDDQTVSLAIGETRLDVDFPYYFTGKNNLGDYVWTDTSGNGNWTDEGAQFSNGINGVTVTLYLDDGDGIFDPGSGGDLLLVTTVTTGTGPSGTGFYNFLIPAVTTPQTYWAAPTGAPLAGLALTSGTVFGDAPMLVTNSGASITTVDFGYARPVTVTGGVYNDPLANMSGATGLAGVVITATLSGGSPVTTTTDASGLYTFTNLMPGSYTIVEGTPVGYESTGDVDGANDDTINLTLTSGNDVTGQNFWDRPGGSIGDLVWYDTDGDGVRDGGEVGIPGVVISLTNSVGGVVTKTTNASGLYSFTELLPGVYTVTVASGTPGGTPIGAVNTSGPDSKSSPYQVTLAANQDVTNADFGYDSPSNYIISKTRMGFDTVRTNAEVSYTIRITNTGQSWLTTVPLSDSFDSRLLQYFSASVPPMGTLHQSPLAWPDVTTTLGDVAPGGAISLTVTFITMRDTTLIAGGVATNTVTAVNPLADPDGPGGPLGELEVLPSKTATATVAILGPTNVSVINTSVRPLTQGDSTQVQVAWQTVNEVDVVGFHIYRRGPGDAVVQVSAAPMLAENAGQPNGDLYAFVDPSAVAGEAYVYVLQILLASGGTEEHTLGPVQWTRQIFLPLVVR